MTREVQDRAHGNRVVQAEERERRAARLRRALAIRVAEGCEFVIRDLVLEFGLLDRYVRAEILAAGGKVYRSRSGAQVARKWRAT